MNAGQQSPRQEQTNQTDSSSGNSDELNSCKDKPAAFAYYQAKYFHQDRLMWSRLQLFFAIQAATLSVGLTSNPTTAYWALGAGFVLAGIVYWLFGVDDKFRREARGLMERVAKTERLKVPIVGEGKVFSHPNYTKWVLGVILGVDVVVFIARLADYPLLSLEA